MSEKNHTKKRQQQGRQKAVETEKILIQHPAGMNPKTHNLNFAAYGLVDPGIKVRGVLTAETPSATPIQGTLIYIHDSRAPFDSDHLEIPRKFWIMYFQIPPSLADPSVKYKLEVFDSDDPTVVATTEHIDISESFGGGVTISYPQRSDCPLPLQFAAYGQAQATPTLVTGTISNTGAGTTVSQAAAPPNWGLYWFFRC